MTLERALLSTISHAIGVVNEDFIEDFSGCMDILQVGFSTVVLRMWYKNNSEMVHV